MMMTFNEYGILVYPLNETFIYPNKLFDNSAKIILMGREIQRLGAWGGIYVYNFDIAIELNLMANTDAQTLTPKLWNWIPKRITENEKKNESNFMK